MKTLSTLLALSLLVSPLTAADPDSAVQEHRVRAAAALEKDLKADPDNSELWIHLGFAYRKTDDLPRAQAAFEKALVLNPKSTESLYMLGMIYESKGQKAEAQKTWNTYLTLENDATKRAVAEKHIHHLSQ